MIMTGPKRSRWWVGWLALVLAVCLAGPAAATLTDYHLGDQAVLDGSSGVIQAELGASYPGGDAASYTLSLYDGGLVASDTPGASGVSAASSAANATTWWYISTANYRVLIPGTSAGPYTSYYLFATGLANYLPESYSAATAVLGANNSGYGKINVWLDYRVNHDAAGWYYMGQGYNDISLNLWTGGTTAYYGGVASHETAHLLLDHETDIYNRQGVASSWVTEALAWYVQESVYAYGDQNGYAYNSAMLRYYSQDGRLRSNWYESGGRYNGWIAGEATNLDYVQMETIGYFLANSTRGWAAIQDTVDYLASGLGIDASFSMAYGGLSTGMYGTTSGAGVGTLYSYYLNYYLGHY